MRFVTVKNYTFITPLQMDGPIVNPIAVSERTIRDLVRSGYDVHEKIWDTDVKLNNANYKNPAQYLKDKEAREANAAKAASEAHTKQVVNDRKFTKNAPIQTAPVEDIPREPEPEPEEEKSVIEKEYNFGTDVEVIDTTIEPEPEIAGRLFTGRPEPDVSEEIDSVAEVDISSEGKVEDKKTVDNRSNNRLQNKRKHKK